MTDLPSVIDEALLQQQAKTYRGGGSSRQIVEVEVPGAGLYVYKQYETHTAEAIHRETLEQIVEWGRSLRYGGELRHRLALPLSLVQSGSDVRGILMPPAPSCVS